jgi:hypothetical protein
MTTPDKFDIPPHDLDAESALLGSMLWEPAAIETAAALLKREDFYSDQHRLIFKAIVDVGLPDPMLVGTHLKEKKLLDKAGDQAYLISLRDSAIPGHVEQYAEIVVDRANRRRALNLYHDGTMKAHDLTDDDYLVDMDPVARTLDDKGLGIIDARVLMTKKLPEPRWAVPGILPEGLSLLVGKPKQGKSFMGVNIGLAVAFGGKVLGRDIEYGETLALCLEDSERRLQERLRPMLNGSGAPDSLHLVTSWPRLDDGGAEHLHNWLNLHLDCRLVVVDTFAKVIQKRPGQQHLYLDDYAAVGPLKQIADEHRISIMAVHHLRKSEATNDALDEVSGSTGLTGAADSVLILKRSRGRSEAELLVVGRDMEDAEYALDFDKATCTWKLLGSADDYRKSEARADIIDLLREEGKLGPAAVASALGRNPVAVRVLMRKMVEQGDLQQHGRGVYSILGEATVLADTAGG